MLNSDMETPIVHLLFLKSLPFYQDRISIFLISKRTSETSMQIYLKCLKRAHKYSFNITLGFLTQCATSWKSYVCVMVNICCQCGNFWSHLEDHGMVIPQRGFLIGFLEVGRPIILSCIKRIMWDKCWGSSLYFMTGHWMLPVASHSCVHSGLFIYVLEVKCPRSKCQEIWCLMDLTACTVDDCLLPALACDHSSMHT